MYIVMGDVQQTASAAGHGGEDGDSVAFLQHLPRFSGATIDQDD
jgi:hypothetical protein